MTDYTELKRLAEAAQEDPNSAYLPCPVAFMNAATPSVVLSLIAETEELGRYLCTCRDCGGEGALHTGDWHSYGHMEPPEPVMEKCGECDGTGLLGEIQDLYRVITERDELRAQVAGLKTGYEAYERVNAELKADNEALRAKLENPDPILIQCLDAAIAEQEQLKRCAGRYEWLRDKQTFIWLIQDWFPSDAEFTDVDAVIDAAMGQGERS